MTPAHPAQDAGKPLGGARARITCGRAVEYRSAFKFANGMLGNGELSPGEYVTGTVVLEVQERPRRVIVKCDRAVFDPKHLYWIVEL
jgi:hypothetical protein